MKEHKLLRIRVTIDCEIVGDDIFVSEFSRKAAEAIFRANRKDIINEAIDNENFALRVSEIKSEEDLPEGYTRHTLPWANASYGRRTSDMTIGEILDQKEAVEGETNQRKFIKQNPTRLVGL
jgi:hypothetical protein